MRYENPAFLERERRRRLVLYLLSFVAVVCAQTVAYWWGMTTLEGEPRSLLDSLGVVVQSLTTTGYGQDAPWDGTFLQVLVITTQITGIGYIFVAFPLSIVPWLRNAFLEPSVPDAVEGVEGHVVICGYSSLCATLVDDLEARDEPYVIVESDDGRARDLYDSDRVVVSGELTAEGTLHDVNAEDALAIVVDTREIDGVETVLTIREFDRTVDVLCLIEEPEHSQYLRYAGATSVLSPKHRLGKSLADKAQNTVSTDLEDVEELDVDIEIAEFPISEDSDVYGKDLKRLEEIRETEANVVGAWIRGEFETSFSPGDYLDENSVLVVAGTGSQLEAVSEITRSKGRYPTPGPVVIAGHGITGTTAEGILRKAGREVTVIDTEADDGVDVVGDATNTETLHRAGVADAGTVILTLSDDDAMLATLVVSAINDDAEIVVAATELDNPAKLYSAGADFVLTLSKVASRMITLELFEKDVMTLREQIQLRQLDDIDASIPDNDEIREPMDSVIVAARRDGHIETGVDDGIDPADDGIIVAGTDEGVNEFEAEFCR